MSRGSVFDRFDRSAGPRLTDDALTLGPRARTVRGYLRDAIDRLAGADPGLTQLRMGLQAVLGIGAGVGLSYVFVRATGALQLAPGSAPPPVVSAYNHALLIVALLLAGMVAMLAGFTVTDRSAKGQLLSTALLPVPLLAGMSAGLAIGPYRVPSLIFLIVLLTVAVYVRRWGPRGFSAGVIAFNGGFLGFFLHADIAFGDIGWLAAVVGVGAIASLAVRFAFFRPDVERTLRRMRRSWQARARRLLSLGIAALQAEGASRCSAFQERLRRQVVRLNEATLMIDAQLAESVPQSAALEAQRLFDAELALSNCARFAGAMAALGAEREVRSRAAAALRAVLAGSAGEAGAAAEALAGRGAALGGRVGVLARRLAASVEQYLTALARLTQLIDERIDSSTVAVFTPAVELNAGFLPGSFPVSLAASTTPGRGGLLDRATMPPYLRASIQVAVAATLAVVVGDAVSGKRLYWAVLATFLAFLATTNSGEQVRKALFRVTGTAIGIVLGDLLVHLTGGHVWSSLIIVLVALFFGIYLIRVNYTFMTIGITVTMAQLYVQLDEFSWGLMLLRLGETAIGVGAVVLTVLLIVPLRPQRVLTSGVLLWFRALQTLLELGLARLADGSATGLRPAVREQDAAYAALEAAAVPLRRTTFGRNSAQLTEIRSVSAAARNYVRSFAAEAEDAEPVGAQLLQDVRRQLAASLAAVDERIGTGTHGCYVRCAALVEVARGALPRDAVPARLALRDLTLLDGALARLAAALDMDVRDHDTTVPPDAPEPAAPAAAARPPGRADAPHGSS